MKRFFIQYISLAAIAFGIIGLLPNSAFAASVPVVGWAWSYMPNGSNQAVTPGNNSGGQGLGWISLDSSNGGNVSFDATTGQLSGYGWTPYGGWLDFSPSGSFPATPNKGASVDPNCLTSTSQTQCTVTGWARFLAGTGNNPSAGGWDGWVSMSGTGYKVVLTKTPTEYKITGDAWGDDVAGWIGFDGIIEKDDESKTCTSNTGKTITYQGSEPYECKKGRCPYKVYAGRMIKENFEEYYLADGLPAICSVAGCMDTDTASYSSVNAFNITNPNPLATVPGLCTYSCIGVTDGKGYNYSANPPYTKNHPSQCIDGPVCTNPNGCPPTGGPIIPIYKEN